MTPELPRLFAALASVPLLVLAVNTALAATVEEVERVVNERIGATLQPGSKASSDRPVPDSPAELTADGAVQAALLNNRGLRAALSEIGISDAELRQAGRPSNPELEFEVRSPDHPYELALTQDVVDLFVRPLRKRAATARRRETELRIAHEVLDLAAQVRSAFYTLQGATQARAMRATIVAATEVSAELARRQYAAGNISDLMLETSHSAHDQALLDLAESELELVEAREELARLMGVSGQPWTWQVAERLPELPASEPDADRLESLAVSNRLDLAASEAELEAAREEIPLARRSRGTAFGLGVHVEREPDGEITVGPALHFTLPFFDGGQAAESGARLRLEQGSERQAALAVDVRSEVRIAHARLLAARKRAQYIQDTVLPRRQRIVAATQREYNFMLVGVYQLIEARQEEVNASHDHILALRDYWIARSQLQRAVGGGFDPAGAATGSTSPAREPSDVGP